MQDNENKAEGVLGYDKTLVSLTVVAGAILLLILILLYLHFDGKITKFCEDTSSSISKLKKAMKAKVRYVQHIYLMVIAKCEA